MVSNDMHKPPGVGSIIKSGGDSFEILSELGRGGMGVVYKARQASMAREVAVKMVNAQEMDAESIQRFAREARAVGQLNHPNIVTVYTIELGQQNPFIVMELVHGKSLSQILKEQGKLTAAEFYSIFDQVLEAIQHTHEREITHRDIKPSNIHVTTDGGAKLMDFGIAKSVGGDSAQKVTRTGAMVGSPWYMSPEQCSSQPADKRSDIYSLGCTMYEALTGEAPYKGENPFEVIIQHLHGDLPSLHGKTSDALANVVAKAMARDPENRFQTASELRAALVEAKQGRSSVVRAQRAKKKSLPRGVTGAAALATILLLAAACLSLMNTRAPVEENLVGAHNAKEPDLLWVAIENDWEDRDRRPFKADQAISDLNAALENSKLSPYTRACLLRAKALVYQRTNVTSEAATYWVKYIDAIDDSFLPTSKERIKHYHVALSNLVNAKSFPEFDVVAARFERLAMAAQSEHYKHHELGFLLYQKALVAQSRSGRPLDAIKLYRESMSEFNKSLPVGTLSRLTAHAAFAEKLVERGLWKEAPDVIETGIALADSPPVDADKSIPGIYGKKLDLCKLALMTFAALADEKRFDQYWQVIVEAYENGEINVAQLEDAQTQMAKHSVLLAKQLVAAGQYERAHKRAAAAAQDKHAGRRVTPCALTVCQRAKYQMSDYESSLKYGKDAADLFERISILSESGISLASFQFDDYAYLGRAYMKRGDNTQAAFWFNKAHAVGDQYPADIGHPRMRALERDMRNVGV
jgi:serine/threonine protein kinase